DADPAEEPKHQNHGDDRAVFLKHLHDHDGCQNQRNSKEDVSDTRQDGIDPAAEEAGNRTDKCADDSNQRGGKNTYEYRSSCAVDNTRVDIAALAVKAKDVA